MDFIKFNNHKIELPFKVVFSLDKIIPKVETSTLTNKETLNQSDDLMVDEIKDLARLREGFENLEDIEKYEKEISSVLAPLFPSALQENEIKAVMLPFTFVGFNLTKRFTNILNNAGDDFVIDLLEFDEELIYIFACSFILAQHYNTPIDSGRPLYIDIPDKKNGLIRSYRGLLNVDFNEIIKTESAPEITQEDIDELLQNGSDVNLWKKKFPPGSYIFKGFSLMSLFDITQDVIINKIRSLFLRNDDQVFVDFQKAMSQLLNLDDLMIGYSTYDLKKQESLGSFFNRGSESLILKENERLNYGELFCLGVQSCVIDKTNLMAISDVDQYGEQTNYNEFYQRLKKKNIKSIILVPLELGGDYLQLIELASTRKNGLNSLNAHKLQDVTPYVKIASQRYIEESMNTVESTIQENYTSIHPAVKWRFSEAAIAFNRQKAMGDKNPTLENISFDNVYPLYGQTDIKDSSVARNEAIKTDLEMQLDLVIETFEKILEIQPFPIYRKMMLRVNDYLDNMQHGINAGDEVAILQFLKKEIYPVFNHLKLLNPKFEEAILAYMAHIDPQLHIVYRVRKSYDESVALLNDELAAYIDSRQEQAQKMFPHYFQRYKTDGVEYNIYMGEELVKDQQFNEIYLHNLRLYQLETMWGLEQVAHHLVDEMPHPLKVASLVLVHSHPLSIKFHMEQKQFDVDGAYNARYEIVKKRIDKSHVKGTNERLTQPGKIAIVYSQDSDAEEYMRYLEYWKTEGIFGEIESLELENLQGISGLRALRVEVIFQEKIKSSKKPDQLKLERLKGVKV